LPILDRSIDRYQNDIVQKLCLFSVVKETDLLGVHDASIPIVPWLNIREARICIDQGRLYLFCTFIAHPMTMNHMLYREVVVYYVADRPDL